MKETIIALLVDLSRMEPLPKYAHLAYLDWASIVLAAFCLFVMLPLAVRTEGKVS